MEYRLTIILMIFTFSHLPAQAAKNDDMENSINAYAEMASSFLKEQNAENVGGLINSFVQSEGGKQLGDMLMGMGDNKNANQILQSLGSLMSQNSDGATGGFDPTILANVLSVFNNVDTGSSKKEQGQDFSDLLSMFSGLLGNSGGGLENVMGYLPMLLTTVNSFTGDEAHKPVEDHSGHAWFLPPILEKLHVAFDHLMNSELGRSFMKSIASEKIIKVFADKDGKFNFGKFVELLENHSFRKHWIELVTKRIAIVVSYFADPKTQKRFLTTAQYFLNNFLKSQGFPKTAMFDPARPTETLSAFVNYFFKKFLNYKVSAKQYIKPAVEYVQDLVKIVQKKGFFTGRGIDSTELSSKLADTINLEIIEPVARVYRAYRFAKRNPQCDRYVMCLVTRQEHDEGVSLPGLKNALSRSTSLFASWFLSGYTGTSFWSLYYVIVEDDECQARFKDPCNEFHVEEVRVTTEYVHNEL